MLEMQRAQRFPACPPNPDTSVFAQLFPVSQPAPSQPNTRPEKEKHMHINWNPLAFLSDLSAQRILTRFDSLPARRLAGFFLQEFWGPHPQDACPRPRSHEVFLQDVY